jgi:hypothetical protein
MPNWLWCAPADLAEGIELCYNEMQDTARFPDFTEHAFCASMLFMSRDGSATCSMHDVPVGSLLPPPQQPNGQE